MLASPRPTTTSRRKQQGLAWHRTRRSGASTREMTGSELTAKIMGALLSENRTISLLLPVRS